MSRKCKKCGKDVQDNEAKICLGCGTPLPEVPSNQPYFTTDQEQKISELVAERLAKNKKFRRSIALEVLLWIGAVVGVLAIVFTYSLWDAVELAEKKADARLDKLDIEISNKIAYVQYSIETNIAAQFQDTNISGIVKQVAANQASNLMVQQINPQIIEFKKGTDNTLSDYNKALADFEIKSTNALTEVKQVANLLTLCAGANSDSYEEFMELYELAKETNQSPEIERIAAENVNTIVARVSRDAVPDPAIKFNYMAFQLDEDKCTFDEMFAKYKENNNELALQIYLLNKLLYAERFPKYDRLNYAAYILGNSPSLLSREAARRLLSEESKIHFTIIYPQPFIDWWNANKDKYTNSIAPKK